MFELSVSVVVYHSDERLLQRCLSSLDAAVECLQAGKKDSGHCCSVSLSIVDNAAEQDGALACRLISQAGELSHMVVDTVVGHGNVGYGVGHNLAMASVDSRYHLILNPDVDLAEDALVQALTFLDRNPQVVGISPRVCGKSGELQYLCRRYPSVFDLFIRGFLPYSIKKRFMRRLAIYEMRAEIDGLERPESSKYFSTNIISGCFMLFRSESLKQLNGFDPRYFLYFEDYDLSLRASAIGLLAYVPAVKIVHHGGGASRKGFTHVKLFVTSAVRFFHQFGWRWF